MLELALILASALARFDGVVQEANRLQDANRFAAAETLYREALAQAQLIHPASHAAATAHNNLAATLYRLGQFEEARLGYERALAIWAVLNRPGDLVAAHANLAELLHGQGRDAEAIRHSSVSMDLRQKNRILSTQAPLVHGNILRSLGKPGEARRYLEEAAEGPDASRRGSAWTSLAQLELMNGNFAEARAWAQRAIGAWNQRGLGQSIQAANSLIVLSRALKHEGDWSAAEGALRAALEALTASLGRRNPRVIAPLADLAELLQRRNRRPDALKLLIEAEQTARLSLGENHPDYAALLLTIGDHHEADNPAEALRYRTLALRHAELIHGEEGTALAPYLNNLAVSLVRSGDTREAEELFRRSLSSREKRHGKMHIENAEPLLNLAVICLADGRIDEARSHIERSLAIRQQSLGDRHPTLAPALQVYARILAAGGQSKDSKRIEAAARAIWNTDPANRHTVDLKTLKSFRE